MRKPNELTRAEWAVIKAVWEREPCTAPEIQEKLLKQTGWAYSTVKTTMDRMVRKGLLRVQQIRKLRVYSATVDEMEAKRGEFSRMLQRAFDGALGPMMQFLVEQEGLSAAEARQLRKMAHRMIEGSKRNRAVDPHGEETKDGDAQ